MKKGMEIYKDTFSRESRLLTVDEDSRSIQGILTTEAPAIVFDWYRFEPIQEVLLMSGAQLPERVVLLNSHSRESGHDVVGTTRDYEYTEVDGYKAIQAKNYFSSTEETLYTKAKEGHLRDTSIGYVTSKADSVQIKPGKSVIIEGKEIRNDHPEMMMYVRTKWWLKENSLVPIGADQRAKLRAEFSGEIEQEQEDKKEEGSLEVARTMIMNQNIYKHLKTLVEWRNHKC